MASETWQEEISTGKRFQFGKNWQKYADLINKERIDLAKESLQKMLGAESLEGKTFLDVGCGSGLFSLSANNLGAKVISFDYDPESVSCSKNIAQKFKANMDRWHIEQGSVLDPGYLESLKVQHGQFDIVYSWGVLHHTGQMWQAIENLLGLVKQDGKVYIAIYNDQGFLSKFWLVVKKLYCVLPSWLKWMILIPAGLGMWGPMMFYDLVTGKGFSRWTNYQKKRGMSPIYDVIDWVGGYPFEVSTPQKITSFFEARNFKLENIKTVKRSLGCCEYVFKKLA